MQSSLISRKEKCTVQQEIVFIIWDLHWADVVSGQTVMPIASFLSGYHMNKMFLEVLSHMWDCEDWQ